MPERKERGRYAVHVVVEEHGDTPTGPVVVVGRYLAYRAGEGYRQPAARRYGAREDVRQPVAALLAGREELDKRIRMRGNPPERMDPTTQHDDDEWCTSRRERLDQLRLEAAQFQARGVVPFTYRNRSVQPALAGQHQDRDLGVAGGLHRVGKARPIIAEHLASSGVQDLDVVAQDGAQACARCDVRSEVRAGRIGAAGVRHQHFALTQNGVSGLVVRLQVDRFEMRRVVVVALEQTLVVGARPDHCDAPQLGRKRQEAVVEQ